MQIHPAAFQLKDNPRSLPFADFSAKGANQCLDVREHYASTGGRREDGFERAAVLCLHCLNDSIECYHMAISGFLIGFLNINSVTEEAGENRIRGKWQLIIRIDG